MLIRVKGLTVTKHVKQIRSEGTWGKLEEKNYFKREARTKYLRKNLVFL